jgi:hypothetical protein
MTENKDLKTLKFDIKNGPRKIPFQSKINCQSYLSFAVIELLCVYHHTLPK